MYDWNGNGKHDAFDDAMFHALLEDDLKRNPLGKKHAYRNASDSSNADIGCFLVALLPLLGIGIVFVYIGGLLQTFENGSIGLLLVLAAILGVLIYFYRKNSIGSSSSTDSTLSSEAPTLSHIEQPSQTKKTPIVPPDSIEHIGDHDVSEEKNPVVIEKFTGVDSVMQTVPSVNEDCSEQGEQKSSDKREADHSFSYVARAAAGTMRMDAFYDTIDWADGESARNRLDDDLLGTGYDSYDLEWMDEDEREEILRDNGLDPLDYDFYDLDNWD